MISIELRLVPELETVLLEMSGDLGKPLDKIVERTAKNLLVDREDLLAAQAVTARNERTYMSEEVWQYLEENCGFDGKQLDEERLI
jgi:predicted DNA-binding protein